MPPVYEENVIEPIVPETVVVGLLLLLAIVRFMLLPFPPFRVVEKAPVLTVMLVPELICEAAETALSSAVPEPEALIEIE
jgi:hypothetical protein